MKDITELSRHMTSFANAIEKERLMWEQFCHCYTNAIRWYNSIHGTAARSGDFKEIMREQYGVDYPDANKSEYHILDDAKYTLFILRFS